MEEERKEGREGVKEKKGRGRKRRKRKRGKGGGGGGGKEGRNSKVKKNGTNLSAPVSAHNQG